MQISSEVCSTIEHETSRYIMDGMVHMGTLVPDLYKSYGAHAMMIFIDGKKQQAARAGHHICTVDTCGQSYESLLPFKCLLSLRAYVPCKNVCRGRHMETDIKHSADCFKVSARRADSGTELSQRMPDSRSTSFFSQHLSLQSNLTALVDFV